LRIVDDDSEFVVDDGNGDRGGGGLTIVGFFFEYLRLVKQSQLVVY